MDFEQDIINRKKHRERYNRISNLIGVIKVCLVLMILATIYVMWEYHFVVKWVALAVTEIAVFAVACIYHNRYLEKVSHEDGLILIDEHNIKRRNGEWQEFADTGREYIDYKHDYAMDLDLVGEKSIFQFLNSTHTYYGRTTFAKDLLNASYSGKEIQERQKAIAELSSRYDFTSEIEYRFSKIGMEINFSEMIGELKQKERFFKHLWVKYILWILRFFTIVAIFYGVFADTGHKWVMAAIMFSLQIVLCIFGEKK